MQLCRKRSKEAGILRLPIAALAALVLVGLLAGAAGAHKASYSSKLSIKLKPSASRDSFKGTVKAGDGCEQARKVKLFYQAADGGGGGGGEIGRAHV